MKFWKIAEFLEEIPSRLPFAAHRYMPPVDQFSRRDMAIYTTWLLAWFGFGAAAVGWQYVPAGGAYLLLGPCAYVVYLYLACTKCPYYGKRCYMGGGQCAQRLFKPRQGDYTLAEDLAVPALWIGVSAYPALWLLYYQRWLALVVYCALALGWQIFHKRQVCAKCLNVRCALNPRFIGRSGRGS